MTNSNKILNPGESYAALPDKALWRKLMEGDKDALAFIYRSYFPSLFKYGMKLNPDESLVKDCIHDIFVSVWLSRERLSLTDSIKYYLLASLKRKIASQAQKAQPEQLFAQALRETAFSHSPEEALIGEQSTLELRAKLARVMEQLPPRQKEILYLRFYEGLDTKETAAIMELSVNSTYVLLSKALSYLKKNSDQLMIHILIVLQVIHF
ncbi:sigma-70 family RNA polymerase sigma factor [Chitinophaga sp. XS-30]|nr:sigma-70 family RNA polymerase sigma factor [Chitinophaga sp. XS-30]